MRSPKDRNIAIFMILPSVILLAVFLYMALFFRRSTPLLRIGARPLAAQPWPRTWSVITSAWIIIST